MFQKLLLTVAVMLTSGLLAYSQSGTLQGKVTNKETKEPIPFANIVLESGGSMVDGDASDFNGEYKISPIIPGTYDVKVTVVGYKPRMITGVIIKSSIRVFNIEMESSAQQLEKFTVTEYEVPLIDKDQTSSGQTLTADEIKKMPGRSAASVAATVGGVFTDEDGNIGGIRGQRASGTVTYVDGVRVRGSSGVPQAAISQVAVVTGGLPPQYGDATGGIINITTKGPSRKFGLGLELVSSQLTDPYGYNLLGFNFQGPLFSKTDELTGEKNALLGFFLSGELNYINDANPAAGGVWVAEGELLEFLQQNPIRTTGLGFGSFQNAAFVHQDELVNIKTNRGNSRYGASLSGKLDVKTGINSNLSFGARWNYNDGQSWGRTASMFNPDLRGQNIFNEYSFFGRYTQRFPTAKEDQGALIKNLYYTINANYTKTIAKNQHRDHKDDLFKYGYVGQFETFKANSYERGDDTITGHNNVWIHNGFRDTLYTFNSSDINPLLSNYTEQFYNLYDLHSGIYASYLNVQNYSNGYALLNGDAPASVYGLYPNTGAHYASYGMANNTQFAVNAHASADVGKHEIQFGIQYEQRIDRSYSLAPRSLWTVMRQYANSHIRELDLNNPIPVYDGAGYFQDTINYNRLYDASSQYFFDYNLRQELGLAIDGLDWIDVDNLDPNLFSIDMFSADELLRDGGNAVVAYYGYDHTGKIIDTKPSLDDFFTDEDEYGNKTRLIPAFEPIYIAGYIQDKFAINDLIFNVGVRIDRFDANQPVLRDPYLLYEAKTVQEVSTLAGEAVEHPSGMGDNYVVYVNDIKNPSAIVGYRDGNQWYNAAGTEVVDPEVLQTATGIAPYLVNPDQSEINSSAFKDYEPQTNFLPRISFSFPISDEALFFAHYDVLTKRPTYGNRMNPIEYLFIYELGGGSLNNPALEPERTVDYELGFQQKLNAKSSLKVSAYYREIRNLVQAYRFSGAYPVDYYSYSNLDFGTVKGFTLTYDLRRTNNVWMKASYTMQFADGTGSNEESASSLIRSGQPNLRTTNPLSFDRRHDVRLVLDYRYGAGNRYNGPSFTRKNDDGSEKTIPLLENTGMNITFRGGSGVPYSRSSTVYPIGGDGAILDGSLNGSRLPWQFTMDARIDRNIILHWGEKEGSQGKFAALNVYVQILNVLNTKNVMGVYRATGNPDDDGFLSAPEYQAQINEQLDPQAYADFYSMLVNSPYNYSRPRVIRLGVIFEF